LRIGIDGKWPALALGGKIGLPRSPGRGPSLGTFIGDTE
jgi:hypothetical protein